ncbi:uncharacterized protein [Elaeis guineensis]|uniref:Uncharacterized protein LOC105033891 n=1 Tax=Elaeis guineensis var. tenera TaxID=51953 RepID=A0A6I9QCM1_ELAGV|nr:uncharacterized protein LOC105033891 [Elaeis guineensis]
MVPTSASHHPFSEALREKRKIPSLISSFLPSNRRSMEEIGSMVATFITIIGGGCETLVRYPGTGQYDKFFGEGIYECAGCATPLYKSTAKFNSGCGWPAFYDGLPRAINRSGVIISKVTASEISISFPTFSISLGNTLRQ